MKKVILIILTIASIMLLTVGCSNQTTVDSNSNGTESSSNNSSTADIKYENLIPDPNKIFSEKATTVLNDSQCWYQIKNCTVENFDTYVSECKDMGFTNIHYEGDNGTLKLFYAYDTNKKYYLEVSLDHASNQINVNVSSAKKVTDNN